MTGLRIFAHVEDPDPELFEYLAKKEGVVDPDQVWVDIDIPRDFEFSDEIRQKTIEYGVADDEGNVLAQFKSLAEAEAARGRAKVRFELVVDDLEDERPKGAKKADKTVETVTDSKSGATSLVEAAAGI